MSYSSVGFYGGPGAGKTLTAIYLAIGLSKHFYESRPIAFIDPADVGESVRAVCEIEGVPLQRFPIRAFVDLSSSLDEALRLGACAFVVDFYDAFYTELSESLKSRFGLHGRRLLFHHREELWRAWGIWVRMIRSAPLHAIYTGRLGHDAEESDDTHAETRTKMRGAADVNYEPDLLIEMEAVRDCLLHDRPSHPQARGRLLHNAIIMKDRWRVLNGKTFQWRDINDTGKRGNYETSFRAFLPHFEWQGRPGMVARESADERDSSAVFASATNDAVADVTKRQQIAAEDFQATLNVLWPGQTVAEKLCRLTAQEAIFHGRRSWTAIESLPIDDLEAGACFLRMLERTVGKAAAPPTRGAVLEMISKLQPV